MTSTADGAEKAMQIEQREHRDVHLRIRIVAHRGPVGGDDRAVQRLQRKLASHVRWRTASLRSGLFSM